MTDNDLKTISEKIYSLYDKILKSKFAETVTESEVISLILAIQFLNRQQAEIEDLTERLEAAIAGQETLQKALTEKDKKIEQLTAEKDSLIKTFGECQAEAVREFAELSIKRICENVTAPTPTESYVVERCNQEIDNLAKETAGESCGKYSK